MVLAYNLSLLKSLHDKYVFSRRANRLSTFLAKLIPENSSVLDIGCGSGHVSSLIMEKKKNARVQGVDIYVRNECLIPCRSFDGKHIPYENNSFDVCLFVDVLHHTHDPLELLLEASRVSREFVIIKDHLSENFLDFWTLKIMDWVGNRPHGIVLPYNFLSTKKWNEYFEKSGLEVVNYKKNLHLYPLFADMMFGRNLHFISSLTKKIGS